VKEIYFHRAFLLTSSPSYFLTVSNRWANEKDYLLFNVILIKREENREKREGKRFKNTQKAKYREKEE
jgi:hypothetical protein